MDLSKLNDDELALERLLAKANGQVEGDVVAPFKIEFINRVIEIARHDGGKMTQTFTLLGFVARAKDCRNLTRHCKLTF